MPLFAGSSVPRTSSKPGLPGDHSNTAPVGLRVDDRIRERRAGHEQHGRDDRAVGERRDAVGGEPFGHRHAAAPRQRRPSARRVDVEHLDRFARAVAYDVEPRAAGPARADVEPVACSTTAASAASRSSRRRGRAAP